MSEIVPTTRVLLIDDDQVDRATVRRALRNSGLKVDLVEASDGATGLRRAVSQPFDCILLDYRLPDIDAFDVLKALLATRNGNPSILMLTGEADQDIAFRLMKAGALDYLCKAEATPSNLARAIRFAQARRAFLSELEDARRDAEEKSLALDALNKQKTLLFSVIAHDLRNLFQILRSSSNLLSRAVAKKDLESTTLRAKGITQAATEAHGLMESLFAWASLQMNTNEVATRDVDLGELAREVRDGAASAAESKRLSLTSDCSSIHVCANRDMLSAVLRNLIRNSIKFTSCGGAISIEALYNGDLVEITVTDTGVGMTQGRLDELFRLDRRTTTEGTAGEKGSGLGLFLCRDLTERQGGKLSVESSVGRGTTFLIVLPASSRSDDRCTLASNRDIEA